MVSKRWKHSKTSIYNIGYHFIWCPKYRKKVLVGKIQNRLKQLLKQKGKEIDTIIETIEVMEDHVHVFVKTNPTVSPHWIMSQFKGYSSRILRQEFSKLKSRLPCLWTRSYYCESIGHISEDTIKKYIEDQKNK